MIKRFLSTLLVFSLLSGCNQKPETVVDLDGNTINFQDYRGKWVVINYWAGWCSHCLRELPQLNQFYETNKTKVVIFGINYDHLPLAQLQALVKKLDIRFSTLVVDPARKLGFGSINAIPVTYLIDPDGNISPPLVGAQAMQTLQETTGLTLTRK